MIFMFFKSKTPTTTTPTSSTNNQTNPTSYNSPVVAMYDNMLPFKQKQKYHPLTDNLQGTNLVEEHMKLTIQYPVDESDTTIAHIINISPIPNQKKRFIDFQSFSTYLLNYGGSDFPSGISMCITELSGYVNGNGSATNVVATTMPNSLSTVLNPGGIIGYNVIYQGNSNPIWDITGINTLTLKLKLFGDTDYRPLPAAQPIQICLKISRVVF